MQRVLVVDDTKNIRMLLSACLKAEGFEVLAASTGKEAIDLIEDGNIDLIFLDIKMPGMSGTEVLKRIRTVDPDTPVVIMTAFATVKNAIDCTRMGAAAYLQKPFTTEKVRSVLADIKNLNNIDYYLDSGRRFILEGNTADACAILKKALSIDPACPEVYRLLGEAYRVEGKTNEADKFFRAAEQFKG